MDSPVAIGDVVDGLFRVDGVLGSGGMGVVVSGTRVDRSERVAIKFMRLHARRGPAGVERFMREARASLRLRSEHVARVIDVGVLDGELPYIVFEHLDGEDLAQLVRRAGPLAAGLAADYIAQAASAMSEAHAEGIIHRDLKPSNLFVTSSAAGPRVKVLDFGVAKWLLGGGRASQITDTGAMLGSPLYMSPEQTRSSRDVDARTDIWGLGAVLYYLIAGESPFAGASVPEVCVRVLYREPAPLEQVSAAPVELARVVDRCLRKDPAERYASASELQAALAPFVGIADREGPAPQPRAESSSGSDTLTIIDED